MPFVRSVSLQRWILTVSFVWITFGILLTISAKTTPSSSSSSFTASSGVRQEDIARGWGEQYTWHTFNESLRRAQIEDKPIMLIYWKSWCNVCKILQDNFVRSEAIRQYSRKFIMVNVGDEIETDLPDTSLGDANSEDIRINVNGEMNVYTKTDDLFWQPTNRRFAPDGAYVPRILFVDTDGNLMDDIFNLSLDRNDQYRYFYPSDTSIAVAMQRAAIAYNNRQKEGITKVEEETKVEEGEGEGD